MAKSGKAEDCKSSIRGFESLPGVHLLITMAAKVIYFFEDGDYYSISGAYDMRKIMRIKGDLQETTKKKIVAHKIVFISLAELEKEYWSVRPMRM